LDLRDLRPRSWCSAVEASGRHPALVGERPWTAGIGVTRIGNDKRCDRGRIDRTGSAGWLRERSVAVDGGSPVRHAAASEVKRPGVRIAGRETAVRAAVPRRRAAAAILPPDAARCGGLTRGLAVGLQPG
jgi:hypothetical protein